MNKSDKYYLKKGKLELSMLDEDDDDDILFGKSNESSEAKKKDPFADLDFPHTKRIKEVRNKDSNKLKVTQDIYNTLHSMGQFLTKMDATVPTQKSVTPKKTINPAKAQMLEKIASTVKIQEVALPPLMSEEGIVRQPLQMEKNSEQPFTSLSKEQQMQEVILPKCEEASMLSKEPLSVQEDKLELVEDVVIEKLESIEEPAFINEKVEALVQSLNKVNSDIGSSKENINNDIEPLVEETNNDIESLVKEINNDIEPLVEETNSYMEPLVEEVNNDIDSLEKDFNNDIDWKDVSSGIARSMEETHNEAFGRIEENGYTADGVDKMSYVSSISIKEATNKVDDKKEAEYNSQETRRDIEFFRNGRGTEQEMSQNKIDDYVNNHFGAVNPKYIYAKELKKRIDKVINSIRNYE